MSSSPPAAPPNPLMRDESAAALMPVGSPADGDRPVQKSPAADAAENVLGNLILVGIVVAQIVVPKLDHLFGRFHPDLLVDYGHGMDFSKKPVAGKRRPEQLHNCGNRI